MTTKNDYHGIPSGLGGLKRQGAPTLKLNGAIARAASLIAQSL
jgi:hypothetical protein